MSHCVVAGFGLLDKPEINSLSIICILLSNNWQPDECVYYFHCKKVISFYMYMYSAGSLKWSPSWWTC